METESFNISSYPSLQYEAIQFITTRFLKDMHVFLYIIVPIGLIPSLIINIKSIFLSIKFLIFTNDGIIKQLKLFWIIEEKSLKIWKL